jgi:curved DNA-binding protein CbpA
MAKIRTHYENLKVARDAPTSVIKAAYKALCQNYHPDKFQGGKEEAERIMKIVRASYEVLIDPLKRTAHDRWIEEQEAKTKQQNEKPQFDEASDAINEYQQKEGKNDKPESEKSFSLENSNESRGNFWFFVLLGIPIVMVIWGRWYYHSEHNLYESPILNEQQEVISETNELYHPLITHQSNLTRKSEANNADYGKGVAPHTDKSKHQRATHGAHKRPTLADLRKELPQFDGTSDEYTFNRIHEIYFPDMDKYELAKRLNYDLPLQTDKESDMLKNIEDSTSNIKQPTKENNHKEQPLPQTGDNNANFSDGVAPLKIKTSSAGGYHYLVKIVNLLNNQPIGSYFIRSGESIDIKIPLGTYEIRYASGTKWQGSDYLFGSETTYSKADSTFNFSFDGNKYSGYTIELIIQQNGNLRTSEIQPSQF